MNKIIGIGLSILFVVIVIINVMLFCRLNDAEKAIRDFDQLRISIPPELQSRIENSLNSKNEQALTKITDSIIALARQKIIGNEVAAEEAFKVAQEFAAKKDFISARIYCLNAINHAPNKKQYFEALIKIVKTIETPTVADLEQIRSVLELGIYQVDSKDIPAMTDMLTAITSDIEKISTANAAIRLAQEKESIKQALLTLKNEDLSWNHLLEGNSIEQINLAKERLNTLNSLLSGTDISHQDVLWCESEIQRTNALLEYSIAMASINNALGKAENLLNGASGDDELPAINSMIQTANSILSQAWNINFNNLPSTLTQKLNTQAQRIAALEVKFNKVKSQPALKKIVDLQIAIRSISGETYTERINKLQAKIDEIMALVPEVHDLEARRNIEKDMVIYYETLKDYNIKRYKAYQKWVVGKCNDALKLYSSFKRVDEADALRIICDHLMEIDSTLLAPEVAKLHQDVLSKQFAEMGWKTIADWEARLATSKKKSLEDF